jgi:hypothetical protein
MKYLVKQFILGVLLLIAPVSLRAQDTTLSSQVPVDTFTMGYQKIDQIYTWGVVLGLVAAVRYPKHNTDVGGYQDIWMSGDKGGHFLSHFVLSNTAQELGMAGWKAASLGCLAGMGYEWVQRYNGEIHHGNGFSSAKDMKANCAGSFAAWGYRAAMRKYRDQRH